MFSDTHTLSVSELNQIAASLLEENLLHLRVIGEISNLTYATSGHVYFSLKDQNAQVRCALFRQHVPSFPLHNGDEVEVSGKITIYAASGSYQIVVHQIQIAGLGQLFASYEALKKQLESEGLFDPQRKRPLPDFPKTVGVITSIKTAALRDVVSTLQRRMPAIQVIVYPTSVQGENSKQEIVQAITNANLHQKAEVLIVCRGGGSIEDLWSFNEEMVVRAVANSTIPIISGVGHETDFTLTDFAADVRAPTPTGAAEIVSPDGAALLHQIQRYQQQIQAAMRRHYEHLSQKVDMTEQFLQKPQNILSNYQQRLWRMHETLQYLHPEKKINNEWQKVNAFTHQLTHHVQQRHHQAHQALQWQTHQIAQMRPDIARHQKRLQDLENAQKNLPIIEMRSQRLDQWEYLLEAISPQRIMERGFSIITDQRHKIVRSNERLRLGQNLHIRFATGEVDVQVIQENHQKDLFD